MIFFSEKVKNKKYFAIYKKNSTFGKYFYTKPMRKKAFLFDMDGVLIDSEPIHYEIMTRVFEKLHLNLTTSYRHSLTGMAGIPIWEKLKTDYQLPKTASEYLQFHREIFYEALTDYEIEPISGIRELISLLKENGYKIAVASSSEKKLIHTFLNKANLLNEFETIVSGADLPKSKPFPDVFLKTAELLQVAPEECIVLEDSKNGVTAAKAANMFCYGFQNPNSGEQDLTHADKIIFSINEITLNELNAL